MQKNCCNPFEVWGISARCPNWLQSDNVSAREILVPYDHVGQSALPTFNTWGERITKDVRPEVREVMPQSFMMNAVQVPSSMPYNPCNGTKLFVDSGNDEGDGSFEVTLCKITEHIESPDIETTVDWVEPWRFCFKSRVVYIDNQQSYVTYVVGGEHLHTAGIAGPMVDTNFRGGLLEHCDHCQVKISDQSLVRHYHTSTCNDNTLVGTIMEREYGGFFPEDTLNQGLVAGIGIGGDRTGKQFAVNCESFGKDYYIVSSYSPGDLRWSVARIKYTGLRLGEPITDGHPSMEVFSCGSNIVTHPVGIGPSMAVTGDNALSNPYIIMLPSRRVYIDSSVLPHDECHVIARSLDSAPPKLVCGQWVNKDYRLGVGSEDELTGVADGTLSASEVQTVIVDKGDAGNQAIIDYPDEDWQDIQVRSYIHMDNQDIALFDVGGDPIISGDIMATFETGVGGYDPYFLDGGLSGTDLHFNIGSHSISEDKFWIADNAITYSGAYSARSSENDVTLGGDSSISITVQVMGDDDMQMDFWYIHENRSYGSHIPPFVGLTNSPEVDNTFGIYVNGSIVPINIDGVDYPINTPSEGLGGSLIDNLNVPTNPLANDPAFYTTWKHATIVLSPGTNFVRFTRHLVWQDNGHTASWIDNLQFPNLLLGDDYDGRRRYYFDGVMVRAFHDWDWAQHDKDAQTVISSRTSTKPDCIMMDDEQRILIGNPHAVVRMTIDGQLDETFCDAGYFRATASPYIPTPSEPPCYDPDSRDTVSDTVVDPPWGAMDIPLAKNGKIQLRGMNASIRDATDILPSFDGIYRSTTNIKEEFRKITNASSSRWSSRPTCWTLHDDGKVRVPHIQIIWRPTYYTPAWPEAPPYSNPPYTSYFGDFDGVNLTGKWNHFLIHDDRFIASNSTKARWTANNLIVARQYSDSMSRNPQFVWVRSVDDPPSDPMDPNYWNPDSPYNAADPPQLGPWGSAAWILVQAFFEPCGIRIIKPDSHLNEGIFYESGPQTTINELCPDEEDPDPADPPIGVSAHLFRIIISSWNIPFTDFDAVDCNCDCCVKGSKEVPEPRPS